MKTISVKINRDTKITLKSTSFSGYNFEVIVSFENYSKYVFFYDASVAKEYFDKVVNEHLEKA